MGGWGIRGDYKQRMRKYNADANNDHVQTSYTPCPRRRVKARVVYAQHLRPMCSASVGYIQKPTRRYHMDGTLGKSTHRQFTLTRTGLHLSFTAQHSALKQDYRAYMSKGRRRSEGRRFCGRLCAFDCGSHAGALLSRSVFPPYLRRPDPGRESKNLKVPRFQSFESSWHKKRVISKGYTTPISHDAGEIHNRE